MTIPVIGWLPFGSTHESVEFAVSFKDASKINTTDLPFGTITTIGSNQHVIDPVNGLKTGASGGYYLANLNAARQTRLLSGGQITMEVQRSWLAVGGDTIGGTQRACLLLGAGGGTVLQCQTNKAFNMTMLGGVTNRKYRRNGNVDTGITVNAQIIPDNNSEYVRVNVGWWGGTTGGVLVMAVDDRIICAAVTATTATAAFNDFYFGGTTSNGMPDHYMRNFQVSSQPPVFPVIPDLGCVVAFGDSFTGTTDVTVEEYQVITSGAYDSEYVYMLERYMAKYNLFPGRLYGATYGGRAINEDLGGTTFLRNYANDVLAVSPTTILLGAGTNDIPMTGTLSANFEANLKTLITTLMAGPTVKRVVLRDVPSKSAASSHDTADSKTAVNAANAIMAAIPAWWDSNNPARAGKVTFHSVFSAMGGTSANTAFFASNDVHPNNIGAAVLANEMVKSLVVGLMS